MEFDDGMNHIIIFRDGWKLSNKVFQVQLYNM